MTEIVAQEEMSMMPMDESPSCGEEARTDEKHIATSNDDGDGAAVVVAAMNSPTPNITKNVASTTTTAAVTPYHNSTTSTTTTTSTSATTPTPTTATPTTTTNTTKTNEVVTPQLLSLYYQHLFPYDFIYDWFRYGTGSPGTATTTTSTGASGASGRRGSNGGGDDGTSTAAAAAAMTTVSTSTTMKNLFYHREFSFTIQNIHTNDEIYLRYQSFATLHDFQQAIQKRRPMKIDIGAIFTHPPIHKHTTSAASSSSSFQPTARELVFDIDLTDYDDIRNCGCQNANICRICWKYMSMAMEIMTTSLRDDFQFQHVQWFYSGRRGIHCWVCDDTAQSLSDHGRTAIANYLTVNLGNEKNQDVHLPYPLHPYIHRAYEILEPYFIRDVIVSKQQGGHGLLDEESQYEKVLGALPDYASEVAEELRQQWKKSPTAPLKKWKQLKEKVNDHMKFGNFNDGTSERPKKFPKHFVDYDELKKKQRLEIFCTEIVLKYTYPRLDINVSKMRNHLLKSPFCIHPKTGRVCVPISKTEYHTFDPFAVPTISDIIQEYYDATTATTTSTTATTATTKQTDTTTTAQQQQQEEPEDGTAQCMEDEANDETTTKKRNGNHNKTTNNNKKQWECTSLYPYYSKFQNEFLIPLQKESHQRNIDIKEAMHIDF